MFYEDASEYSHPNWFGTIGLFKARPPSAEPGTDEFNLVSDSESDVAASIALPLTRTSLQTSETFLQFFYEQTAARPDIL